MDHIDTLARLQGLRNPYLIDVGKLAIDSYQNKSIGDLDSPWGILRLETRDRPARVGEATTGKSST